MGKPFLLARPSHKTSLLFSLKVASLLNLTMRVFTGLYRELTYRLTKANKSGTR